MIQVDEFEYKATGPLRDADQDVSATVTRLLGVVADMPGRLDPDHVDYDTAVAAFAAGLIVIADAAGELGAQDYIDLAVAELGPDPDAAASLTLVQMVTDVLTAGQEGDFATGLRAIADVVDPP